MTYPQNGHFPTLNPPDLMAVLSASNDRRKKKNLLKQAMRLDAKAAKRDLRLRGRTGQDDALLRKREQWKRDISGRPNGTIDPLYGCDLYGELIDYAVQFSFPWRECFTLEIHTGR